MACGALSAHRTWGATRTAAREQDGPYTLASVRIRGRILAASGAGSGRCRGITKLRTTCCRSEGGSAVIDAPTKTTPSYDQKTSSNFKKPPIYKVLLHNDTYNRREYVVKVLLKVIEGLGVDKAVNVMQEAHMNGMAMVIACAQEEAENYCEGLRFNGLISTLES